MVVLDSANPNLELWERINEECSSGNSGKVVIGSLRVLGNKNIVIGI